MYVFIINSLEFLSFSQLSTAEIKDYESKEPGDERVYFTLQLIGHLPEISSKKSKQKPGGRIDAKAL